MYDVIIIGAGPAGLNCAKHLQDKLKVLVLEKNNTVGPKICAGGLTNKDIAYLKIPKNIIERSFDKVIVHTPLRKRTICMDRPFVYTVDRKKLGQWQLSKLRCEVRKDTGASKVGKDYIIAKGKKIYFKYLIGADGASSIVRRSISNKENKSLIAMQYNIEKRHKNLELFLDSNLFGSWYAWIFPHKNYTSIGCGSDPKSISPLQLKKNFHAWLKKQEIDIKGSKLQIWPISYEYSGLKFGNIFLAGDAAGLASELTGEGIYQALVSGEEAAKAIIDKNYKPNIKKILNTKRVHKNITDILKFMGSFRNIAHEVVVLLLSIRPLAKNTVEIGVR